MFELSHELAQNIVDRAMAILPCNVNVMDSQGLILGSGEHERIDTRHEGAQLVLANQRIVELDESSAACLKGVQPGINLPLMHDERLIGVLGLTGIPEELRTYAQLLRMTAEMLVSERHREVERQWRQQRSEDLLALLLGESSASARLVDEAAHIGLKPHLVRTPVLIELVSETATAPIGDWLSRRTADSWLLPLSAQSLLWCCPSAQLGSTQSLLDKLDAHGWRAERIIVGIPAQGAHRARMVMERVKALAAYGRAIIPGERLLSLERYRVPALLWAHREEDAVQELQVVLDKVRARDSNGLLMQTLRSWCDHSGQIQDCADALGVHRNSLRYRMDKIAEISNLDLNRLDDITSLYLAIQLSPRS
ncbi:sugar diacid recognition domain-containing protein [Pseudomonas gingeri]|uniref:Helix-turn-helix domain-containing protein n=1 Tax=Pseudomonas gingeri TaxID=117681 RepID=A0A7Y8BLA9_9PSED|nr:sugar diacid recognition domain-containing protein [Pseudomonas gingeri]NWB47847.1 helix-turn-helix domain-containing protein [Pseudomonas gingeri]